MPNRTFIRVWWQGWLIASVMTVRPTATWGGILKDAPAAACPSPGSTQGCARCCLSVGSTALLLAPVPVERRTQSAQGHAVRLVSQSQHHVVGRSSWKKQRWGEVTFKAKAHGFAHAVKTGKAAPLSTCLSWGWLSSDERNPKAHSVPVSRPPPSASAQTCRPHPPWDAKGSPAQKPWA